VGHEFSATVARTGAAVTRVKPGDRVAIDPAVSCGRCDQCAAGRRHTCRHLRFLGCPGQLEGCLAERIVMPEECCYPIGPHTGLDQAALSEPLSIGVYAARLAGPLAGARVGILGSGPIGLSVLVAARAVGAGPIYATDKIPARLEAARTAGAGWTGNPDREDVVAEIARREPLLLDAVFECCGEQEALDQAVELLKPGGQLLLVGIPSAERVSFVIDRMRRKEIRVQNVRRQNECTQPALDMIDAEQVNVDFMATHHFPFAETPEAFALVEEYRDGVVKAIVRIGTENA